MRFFDAWYRTRSSTPGVLIFNDADYVKNRGSYDRIIADHLPDNWTIHVGIEDTCGEKLNAAWERMNAQPIHRTTPMWVGVLQDDIVPETLKWDRALIETITIQKEHLVSCNDGWQAIKSIQCDLPRFFGANLWSWELIRAVGFICPPGLTHFFNDDIWECVGERIPGLWVRRMDIMTRSAHPFLTGQTDATHKDTYQPEKMTAALKIWRSFCEPGGDFDAMIGRIRAMLLQKADPRHGAYGKMNLKEHGLLGPAI